MTAAIQRGRLVTVKIATTQNATPRILGYTEEQADTSYHVFKKNVPGDMHGGSDGPPIDVQYLGETAEINLRMSRYDGTVAAEVASFISTKNDGGFADSDVGTLLLQDNSFFRLILDCSGMPQNFPTCEVMDAIQVNRGTKYATFVCAFRAHRNQVSGVIYNTTVS